MKRIFLLFCLFAAQGGWAAETIFMCVPNSRQHRLGQSQNPVIGLFISRDQGKTWQHRGWQESVRLFYAEMGADSILWGAAGNGVMRSADGGHTWKITTDWRVTEVLKVKVRPDLPSTVYAACAYGVFKTTDHGQNWRKVLDRFSADILIDASEPQTVLAAQEEGISISRDGGDTWQLCGLSGKGIRVLAQSPGVDKSWWAGTEDDGVFVSMDQGHTWQPRNHGLNHSTVYAIAFHPTDAKKIYLGTHEGGVYGSTDGGANWQRLCSGLGNAVVHSLVVLPSNPQVVLAGAINEGLFISRDAGQTWTFAGQAESHIWGLSIR